ncbi:cyclic nucleotide-binding domain-containing protein [Archangium violaceum]|uniref:cyclic nucleotide-binding domain-containing protein n=1 Tax=Archangium violaceum TaxID=83451 RepID=UPI002B311F1C|nr:cyclic nucleotide-binding domain-containing protein [Archangium violaceum]
MEPRQLRDKANEALTKGRFTRAAELFEEYCQLDPKDYQARVRLGDAWVKVGNNARAITAYQAAAEGFAREGFLPRAIAASKLILELDPSHQGVQQMLAGLYARRGGAKGGARAVTPAPVATPPTPQAALFIELPPELDETLAQDEATEVELDLEDASTPPPAPPAEPPADLEVELDLREAEEGSAEAAPPQPTVAKAAPPGLRRRSSDSRPPEPSPEPSPQPQPLRVAEVPATSPHVERFTPRDGVDFQPPVPGNTPFTELAVQADSLLHAVELAALAGAAAAQQPEPVAPGLPADDASTAGEESVSEAPSQDEGLPKIPLFSDLPRDAFIALFERCPLRRFPEGTRIIEQGTRGDAFYVICAGRVRIERQIGTEQRSLAVLGEGAFFGEMALLSGAPRSASVVSASEETQVLEISAPVLAALSRRFPQVAKALRRFCRQRLLSDVVNTSALFQPFGRKDRRELVERFRAREVRRGDVIIHEGHQVDGLYVVLSGEVAVSKGGQALARLREGELFGEMSLLQKTPANATVTAARNTSLLRLPREDFDTLILTHPQILILVSELTETRQRSNEALLGGHRNVAGETEAPHEELLLF